MAHVSSRSSSAKVGFSSADKIVLNGADLRWVCDIEPGHVLDDVFTRELTFFSSGEIVRMMAAGAMTVAGRFYEAPP